MKFPKPQKKAQVIDPILPLINVVFLLLIFVMMMSRVESTNDYEVSPPVSTSEEPAGQRDSVLILTEDGQIQLNNLALDSQALLQYAREQKQSFPDEIVKIKADANVDAMKLIALMENLRIGGVNNLVLLTEKRN